MVQTIPPFPLSVLDNLIFGICLTLPSQSQTGTLALREWHRQAKSTMMLHSSSFARAFPMQKIRSAT